jgi:hypothetical protein
MYLATKSHRGREYRYTHQVDRIMTERWPWQLPSFLPVTSVYHLLHTKSETALSWSLYSSRKTSQPTRKQCVESSDFRFSWRRVWKWQLSGIQCCGFVEVDVSEVMTGSTQLWNVGILLQNYTVLFPEGSLPSSASSIVKMHVYNVSRQATKLRLGGWWTRLSDRKKFNFINLTRRPGKGLWWLQSFKGIVAG